MEKKVGTGPLSGVRIVDLSTVVFGPLATMILADLGAEVIKIESPGREDVMRFAGDSPTGDLGPIFTALNRNKASVALDLNTLEGQTELKTLLSDADVFLHNIRMSGAHRLGLDLESVRKLRSDIIYIHCAGFGSDGPYAGAPAYDDLIQAASGYASLAAYGDMEEPQYAPSLIADKTSGLFAAYATLAALYDRQRSGQGQFVEVPMFECFTFFNMIENLYGRTFEECPGEMAYPRAVAPSRKPYRTRDGYIGLVPYSTAQWETFFAIAERPETMTDPRFSDYEQRTKNIEELYGVLADIVETRSSAEWLDLLQQADIPVVRYNTLDEVLCDPHLDAVSMFQRRHHPSAGEYVSVRHPVRFSAHELSVRNDPKSHT